MIITNKMNLPQTLVDAVTFDDHKRGDYSVTDLQKGAKQVWLTRRHDAEIEVDVSERLWALFGTAIHYVLDKGEDKNVLKEESLEADIGGIKLTGRADHFTGKVLSDWKFTSVWSIVYKSSYPDYERQLNCYAFLYGLAGFEVEKIQAVLLLKDWSKSKARADDNYPNVQIAVPQFELWTAVRQRDYIESRIHEFEKYKDVPDDLIPECDPEMRWAKPTKYAIMKIGRKSAVRVLDNELDAKDKLATLDNKHSIQIRPGGDTKCEDYCDCNKFCSYYNKSKDLPF